MQNDFFGLVHFDDGLSVMFESSNNGSFCERHIWIIFQFVSSHAICQHKLVIVKVKVFFYELNKRRNKFVASGNVEDFIFHDEKYRLW